jgi:hypothetical protein
MKSVKADLGRRGLALALAAVPAAAFGGIEVVPHEGEPRVEIRIDGRPFTEYLYRPEQKKPVLYPLRTDTGVVVTRGFPLDPRPGEREDHPHHMGLWFDYGAVQGVDFWNNREGHPHPEQMGTIVHRAIGKAESGKRGVLEVTAEWQLPGERSILREQARYVFAKARHARIIDRTTTLTALDAPVTFGDSKEGVLGLRVARFLEQPEGKGNDAGVTGRYLSSEGKTGEDVWGTRGHWAALVGEHQTGPVTIVVLDHPDNPGHPPYWHARGYGLFAVNPLAAHSFEAARPEAALTLAPGESLRFRHRVLILSRRLSAGDVDKAYRRFIREKD